MGVEHRKQRCEEELSHFTPFTLVLLGFFKVSFYELLCSLKINFKNVTAVFFLTSNNILKQDMNRKKTVRFIDFRISLTLQCLTMISFLCSDRVTNFRYAFMVRNSILLCLNFWTNNLRKELCFCNTGIVFFSFHKVRPESSYHPKQK